MIVTQSGTKKLPIWGWRAGVATAVVVAGSFLTLQFSAGENSVPARGAGYFVPHGAGAKFSEKVEEVEVKLSSSQTDGRYSVQDEVWHPGFDVKPHYHNEHAETFYVMDGQIEWTVNGHTHAMSAGDIIFISPKVLHSVHVVGAKDAHILFISQPGGFEHLEEKRMQYTDAQREDPKVKAALRDFGDAHFPQTK